MDLNSPQHARLLGFDNVEEHEDGMEQVISALWEEGGRKHKSQEQKSSFTVNMVGEYQLTLGKL